MIFLCKYNLTYLIYKPSLVSTLLILSTLEEKILTVAYSYYNLEFIWSILDIQSAPLL